MTTPTRKPKRAPAKRRRARTAKPDNATLRAYKAVLEAIRPLDDEQRERALRAALVLVSKEPIESIFREARP